MGRHIAGAVNARVVPVVEYGPDQRGWSMFAALAARAQRGINGIDGTITVDPVARFTGYARGPQQFTGMAPLGLARPITGPSSTMADEIVAISDPSLRIFAERLRRNR